MGSSLLLYIDESTSVDVGKLKAGLLQSLHLECFRSEGDLALCCDFKVNEYPLTIRVPSDLGAVWVDSADDAALAVALEIQRFYSTPIRLVDEGYALDLPLSQFSSLDELKSAVEEA